VQSISGTPRNDPSLPPHDFFRAASQIRIHVGDTKFAAHDSRHTSERAIVAGAMPARRVTHATWDSRNHRTDQAPHSAAAIAFLTGQLQKRKEIDDAYVPESRLERALTPEIAPFY